MNRKQVEGMLSAVELFRQFNREFPAQTIATFFYVALHEGLTLGRLARRMGMRPNSTGRNIRALQKWGLVETVVNPSNRRERWVTLTAKGWGLIRKVQGELGTASGVGPLCGAGLSPGVGQASDGGTAPVQPVTDLPQAPPEEEEETPPHML